MISAITVIYAIKLLLPGLEPCCDRRSSSRSNRIGSTTEAAKRDSADKRSTIPWTKFDVEFFFFFLLQPEATKMGSFGRKDVSQSRAGVCGKALSHQDRLYYEALYDDIPASNLFKHVERDHIATSKSCATISQCGVQSTIYKPIW